MPRTAEFMAWRLVLTRRRKLSGGFVYVARNYFHGMIGSKDGEAVNDICAGDTKVNWPAYGNRHTVGNKEELLRDQPDGD